MTGPWPTKSGGLLTLPLALALAEATEFLTYDAVELDRIPVDIRGLRVFYVHGVPTGGVGGRAFHRVRTEISFAVKGAVRWRFEDLHGSTRVVSPEQKMAVIIPPFVLHTMEAVEDGTIVATLANTLFVPDNPATHDTFSEAVFRELQLGHRRQLARERPTMAN